MQPGQIPNIIEPMKPFEIKTFMFTTWFVYRDADFPTNLTFN